MTLMPCSAARAMMGSMSQGHPARCTQMTARVWRVTACAMVRAERLPLSGSTSAKTGVAPALTTQDTLAMKVRGVTMTSSPGPMSIALSTASSASVPLPSDTACAAPVQAANSRSNSRHSSPVQ
jgi:hypothetical protein